MLSLAILLTITLTDRLYISTVCRVCVCFSTAHLSALRLERSQPLISGWSSCGDVLEGLSLYFIEGL